MEVGDGLRRGREREQRVAPAVGGRARVGETPGARRSACPPPCAGRPRPRSPSGVGWPASKHRHASKPAKRSTWPKGAGPPLLVADEQQRHLAEVAGAGGERPQDPEGEDVPALHVDRPRADAGGPARDERLVRRRGRRRCRRGPAGARRAAPRRRGAARRGRARAPATSRARAPRRRRRQQRRRRPRRPPPRRARRPRATTRRRAPRARARRGRRSRRRCSAIHGSMGPVGASHGGTRGRRPRADFALDGTKGPFRLADHRGRRVVLLFYPGDRTPVCTRQFCSYRDHADEMDDLDAVVVGSPTRTSTRTGASRPTTG